jgi:hypothetical protein
VSMDQKARLPVNVTRTNGAASEPQHYVAASARELRAQSVHRLQIGLFGLCAMMLIVGLASIILDRAQSFEIEDPIDEVIAIDGPAKKTAVDPLADAGVVPAADPAAAAAKAPSPKPRLAN